MNLAPLQAAFPDWSDLVPRIAARFDPSTHGDLPRWLAALDALPDITPTRIDLGDRITVEGQVSADAHERLQASLQALQPWRKGPFSLFGVGIDTEWRSDWKWQRVRHHLEPLNGTRVLDVGCGNGYFGWRMLEAGADLVMGVDPTLVFCLQHRAVNRYIASPANWVLPLRFEELPPPSVLGGFDAVFSMGVVYHRRDPEAHVRGLFRHTRPGGQVVLESLVVEDAPLLPRGRYARMRNVHVLPDPALMLTWLRDAGFEAARIVDVTQTSLDEQRSTEWMRFESLAAALDPQDPQRTVEGHPRPVRAVVVARKGL